MITQSYLRTMARYNQWQNESLYKAAYNLTDAERRLDRGAFFGSIHKTLSHIYWADRIWLSRFDVCEPPNVPILQSGSFVEDFGELRAMRTELDSLLINWCDDYATGPIKGKLQWYSGAIKSDAEAPLSVVFVHFFNHQTHHRGQVHAMLTATGERMEDTDLFLMPQECWPG